MPDNTAPNQPESANKVPDFALTGYDGSEHTLASLLAKGPTVLIFYRGHWWPYCRNQLGELAKNQSKFDELGASIVGISTDPPDKSRALATKLSVAFPLLEDKGLSVTRKYSVADEKNEIAKPSVFVVNKSGEITWKFLGEGPPDRPPTAEVITALEALSK